DADVTGYFLRTARHAYAKRCRVCWRVQPMGDGSGPENRRAFLITALGVQLPHPPLLSRCSTCSRGQHLVNLGRMIVISSSLPKSGSTLIHRVQEDLLN